MPLPSLSDLHVSAVLTDLSIRFMRNREDFIASKVAPIVPVSHQVDLFRTYNRADWFREGAEKRAPGTPTAGGGFRLSQDSYSTVPYGFHKDIDDMTRSNADSMFALDNDAMEFVSEQLLMKYENLALTSIFEASVWTGAATGNDQAGVSGAPAADQFLQFNDVASAPIELFDRMMTEMHEQSGKRPNTLVVGPRVHDALKEHPDLVEKIKYTQRGVMGEDLIASLLGIENYHVARYTRVTTAEQASSDTYAYQAGKNMWLGFIEPSPGLLKASALYSFSWSGYTGVGGIEGLGVGVRIKKFRIEEIESDRVEGTFAVDVKRVGAILGIKFPTAVA